MFYFFVILKTYNSLSFVNWLFLFVLVLGDSLPFLIFLFFFFFRYHPSNMDFPTAQDVKNRIAFLANQSLHCTNGVVIHQSIQFTFTKVKKFIAFKDLANSLVLKYSETHPVSVPHLVTKIRNRSILDRSLIKRYLPTVFSLAISYRKSSNFPSWMLHLQQVQSQPLKN